MSKTTSKSSDLEAMLEAISAKEEKIKKQESNGFQDENILSFKSGNTYLVRLLPNKETPNDTFVYYEETGFQSITGSGYIYAGLSPRSVGKPDITNDIQWKLYNESKAKGDEAGMRRSYSLFPQRRMLANVYVINDPVNPENNGTVKVLRCSAKLGKDGQPSSPLFSKIQTAILGEDREQIGIKAFLLTDQGVNFRIKVKLNEGGWNDYGDSMFLFPSDLGLSAEEIEEIQGQIKDLNSFVPEMKTPSELKTLMDEHWHGKVGASHQEESELSNEDEPEDEDDQIPMGTTEKESDMDDFLDGIN